MLIIIFSIIFAASVAYLAQFNLQPVSLSLGYYTFQNIPLFYVVIGALLAGLVLSYLLHLIDAVFTAITLNKKDKKIKHSRETVLELTKRVHQLELENERLKKDSSPTPDEDKFI
jgi:putative membrane protein